MINQTIETVPGPSSWVLNPGCLIDRFLDRIEKLRSFVLPVQADDPAIRTAQLDTRLGQFGA